MYPPIDVQSSYPPVDGQQNYPPQQVQQNFQPQQAYPPQQGFQQQEFPSMPMPPPAYEQNSNMIPMQQQPIVITQQPSKFKSVNKFFSLL